MQAKYNDADINSIVEYSNKLIGKTFLDIVNNSFLENDEKSKAISKYNANNYKGGLGILLEELYFGYRANSIQDADFSKVGVELKLSPYEIKKDKSLRAGERLSVTMVPHNKQIETDFYKSDVWHKIHSLLLVYYFRDKSITERLNYRIDYSYLFTPSEEDLKIIISDYNKIATKIKLGKAHEISEADTMYLGACTKGSNAEKSTKPQYYGEHIPARTRNFCLKQSYMSYVLNNYIKPNKLIGESIIKDFNELNNYTFEELIISKIMKNVGISDKVLCNKYKMKYKNNNKAQLSNLTFKILGVKSNKAEEFEKANIVVKAIRIKKDGSIKENMSFPTFKYKEIINESWEDSTIYKYFEETRFLFVVYKEYNDSYILKGSQFWNMPQEILDDDVKKGWSKLVNTIKDGIKLIIKVDSTGKQRVCNNLLKKTENKIIHVRPHSKKSYYEFLDGTVVGDGKKSFANQLPDGRWMTNYCFWINNDYIIKQIKDELKS